MTNLFEYLSARPYPGRGILLGSAPDGTPVCAYFIMGRSENSRNRVFVEQGEELVIHPFDASRVKDPSLIIYSPVRKLGDWLIVTNGDQTDTINDFLKTGRSFEEALSTREFEPDGPNYTPRISGLLHFKAGDFTYKMNIVKSADAKGSACVRETFSYPALAGLGHFLHTYVCDGDPIPSFTGEPERVAIPDDIDAFSRELWENLDPQNKVSLYVRYIDLESGKAENRLINKNV
jgi:IMP cyclohydrolase